VSLSVPVFALALDVPNHTFSFPARDGADVPGLADGWSFSSDSATFACAGAYGTVPGRAGRAQMISGSNQAGQVFLLSSPLSFLPVFPEESSANRTIYPVWGMTLSMSGATATCALRLAFCNVAGSTIQSTTLYSFPASDGVFRSWSYKDGSTAVIAPATAVYARIQLAGMVGASADAFSWGFGPVAVGWDHFDMTKTPSSVSTGPGALSPKVARFGGRTSRLPRTALRMSFPCLSVAEAAALRFYWASSRGSLAGRADRPGGSVPTLVFPGNVLAPSFVVCDWSEDTCPVVPARSWGIPPIFRASPLLTERL
jgi:hypothetical protein